MPRLSNKSGKQPEKQVKKIEFNARENFEKYESKYHLLERLKSKVNIALSGVSDEKLRITYLLRSKDEVERRFFNPDINIVPWLRDERNVINNSHIPEEVYSHSSRYLYEFEGQVDHFTTDLSKRNLESLIERYQSIIPFEMQFLLEAKGSDKKNPLFVAYLFQACHYYYQYLQSLIENSPIRDSGILIEEMMEKLSLNIGPKVSPQSLMIVLKEIGLNEAMVRKMDPMGTKRFDKLMGIILSKNESTIRKIREDMMGTNKKNDPYAYNNNIIEAAEHLEKIGYADLANNLLSKYHLY